jgi:hypothetical protein
MRPGHISYDTQVGKRLSEPGAGLMFKRLLWSVTVLLGLWPGLGSGAQPTTGPEFSADLIQTQAGDTMHTRLYVGRGHIRLEPSAEAQEPLLVILMQMAPQGAYVLMPERQVYMVPQAESVSARLIAFVRFLQPADLTHPCAAFQAHMTCQPLGHDTLQGHRTETWQGTSTKDGEQGVLWIDPRLHFIIKMHGKDWDMELQQIHEGPQPASLFVLPPEYRRLEGGSLEGETPSPPR